MYGSVESSAGEVKQKGMQCGRESAVSERNENDGAVNATKSRAKRRRAEVG